MNTRVYQLAKKYELESKELIMIMEDLKIEVANHMSTLDKRTIEFVESYLNHKSDKEVHYTLDKKQTTEAPLQAQALMKVQTGQENQLIDEKFVASTQLRVAFFVDVQNIHYSADNQYRRKVDFGKLLEFAVRGRKLVSAIAYIVRDRQNDQSNFISKLEQFGYSICSKDLLKRQNGSKKGDMDVEIATDMVNMLNKNEIDVVILASGDGDFCHLAKDIKQKNKEIEIVAFEKNTAMDLKDMANQFFPIKEELLM